jgi:formylglycine-generating enzyme required for sulfatase activity
MSEASDRTVGRPAIVPSRQSVRFPWRRLEGGSFTMGTSAEGAYPLDGEGPARQVRVDGFAISAYAVTNAQFGDFIRETGYTTDAERLNWSFVFAGLADDETRHRVTRVPVDTPWWLPVPRAYWAQPEGPNSTVLDRLDHPVVHVSWHDAKAYCMWAGVDLPTEAEWEYAARGGIEGRLYPWGDELQPGGEHRCNIWQGDFPRHNTQDDGYFGTAPVNAFPANGYGLHNLSGNVWEWCEDVFSPGYHRNTPADNPLCRDGSDARSLRGGSFLCHESYCNRYRVAARSSNTPDSAASNIGFRVVRREPAMRSE